MDATEKRLVCAGFQRDAVISATLLQGLEVIASKHAVSVASLLLLCVHFQLNGGKSTWEGLLASSGLPSEESRNASTAFHLEGWFDPETGIFSPPGGDDCAPLVFSGTPIPSLEKKWQALWISVTSQPVSGKKVMGGVERYLTERGKSLPEPDPSLIRICGDLREGFSVDRFLDDIGRYLQDMYGVLALNIEVTDSLKSRISALRSAYSKALPGKLSENIYVFAYLAAKNIQPSDITHALSQDSGPLWVESCLRMTEQKTKHNQGVNLEALA